MSLTDYLSDRRVCVTGRLVSLTHDELADLVRAAGGHFIRNPRRGPLLMVVGDDGWPAGDSQRQPTQVFQRARQLQQDGGQVQFLSEEAFLARIGLVDQADAICARYTAYDLARLLSIGPMLLRQWIRSGLVTPVATENRLAYFDFRQVACVKRLNELIENGTPPGQLREAVESLKDLIPSQYVSVAQVIDVRRRGQTRFRTPQGIVDQSGQRYFEFDPSAGCKSHSVVSAKPILIEPITGDVVDRLFEQAFDHESQQRWDDAAAAYRKALAIEPDNPVLWFNMGNVLHELEQFTEAVRAYQNAVQFDAAYAEAWNNLGAAQADLQWWTEAKQSFLTAIDLVPRFADAHHNLADVLIELGENDRAQHHQDEYRRHSGTDRLKKSRRTMLRVVGERDE